ncbi:MAG TPA: type II toxin-antitoxin system HipA family toxin, partial [Cyclobacteriaceae bacterium]|nr:type II toxin-antitoxin system HipA family toxin [Cyclobacteriaceae bacterium]
DNSLDLRLAREVAPYFRVSDKRANEIIDLVQKAVSKWEKEAERTGVSKSERELLSRAFRVD